MDEELRQLQLDKRLKGKSEQVIKRHSSISSELSPIDRAAQLLIKGDEIQRINVLNSLPDLAVTEKTAVYNKLLPKVITLLPQSSAEFQIVSAKMFRIFSERNLSVSTLLPLALLGLQHVDPSVLQAWTEALITVIPRLSGKLIQTQILPFIIKDLQQRPIKQKKINYARLLGVISDQSTIDVNVIKGNIIPVVFELSKDPVPEIRGTMCLQYPFIVPKVGIDKIFLEYIEHFGKDDNPIVRGSLLSILGLLSSYFKPDLMKVSILPLLLKLIDVCSNAEDDTKIIVAKEIGTFAMCISECAGAKEISFIVNVYQKLSLAGLSATEMKKGSDPSRNVACRQQCALNLPTMTNFIMSKPNAHEDILYSIIKSLTSDPCYAVRRQAANNFQDIVKHMGSKIYILKEIFLTLLRDSSDDVLVCLIPNLSATLNQYAKQGVLQTKIIENNVVEFGRALLKCQGNVFKLNHWRIQSIFLRQIEFLPAVFPSDYINTQFLPQVFNVALRSGARPTRKQAVRTVLKFLRYNTKQEQRNNIRNRLISEVAKNSSFYTRVLFVFMCDDLLDLFSSEYFKRHFCETFISLADDNIAIIRFMILSYLPKIKKFFYKPNDDHLIVLLEKILKRRTDFERDRDCRKLLLETVSEITAAPILTQKGNKLNDLRDQRLYDEEIKYSVFL